MIGRTHAIIGAAAVTGADIVTGGILPAHPIGLGVCLAAAILGALMPDIDSDESAIRQATGTNRRAGVHGRALSLLAPSHRGVTHSALAVLGLALAWRAWPHDWLLAFVVGYASHIAADMLTPAGVSLAWPLSLRVGLLPGPLRIITGGIVDQALGVGLLVWMLAHYVGPWWEIVYRAADWLSFLLGGVQTQIWIP